MADTKTAVVAFLLVALLVASAAPSASGFCFPECYDRCANGKIGNVPCATMCAQACIVPRVLPDGRDPTMMNAGGN
ncbi:hypothetical protein C4D60_Mb04t06540 [Musa balbisiana]|uniref:Uncharacterized protein n=1 Tax=Musa balbisiana TaxID=52838 RepID=A0A4S8KA41_MUSBA|nr:hypothetical protein C4D60_Mb04t06540 [Musa balbisiana]